MEEHFHAHLEMKSLSVSVFPGVHLRGEELVFRRRGSEGDPPLITVGEFEASGSIFAALRNPPHIESVRLKHLVIQVVRHGEHTAPAKHGEPKPTPDFVLDNVYADGARLIVTPKNPKKAPLEFEIGKLHLWGAGPQSSMQFESTLRNAEPPGDIKTHGYFGPWNADEPAETPVRGIYQFRNADLGVFKGIAGILSSDGQYDGMLDRIVVDGTTDVPGFAVKVSGNPVELKTKFHAVVDGTNGDTGLDPVEAQFGASRVTARGAVSGEKGKPGKTVTLDLDASGRLEDMLRMGAKGAPAMRGAIGFRAKMTIPPGNVDIAEKLQLNGNFEITSARFTSLNMEQKVTDLSHRGQGEPEAPNRADVASDFAGGLHVAGGQIHLSRFTFRAPGVDLQLEGDYGLLDEQLDFHGVARMDAPLSEMTTGWKSLLLKLADPFLKGKNKGAEIPIHITGTRAQPQFGLDLGRKAH